jgi:hypothetical protein
MRKLVFSVIAILFSGFFYAQQLAFPGAEGAYKSPLLVE